MKKSVWSNSATNGNFRKLEGNKNTDVLIIGGGLCGILCAYFLEKAGIQHQFNDGKTFHGIRRSLGTAMVSEGTPVTTVSQVLGHQAIRSTRQYIAMDLAGLQKCAIPLSSIGGGA